MTSRPVETPPVTEPDALGSFPLRAMLVALFTSFGASAATFPLTGLRSRQFPAELVPHFEIPAWLLLGAVLAQAMVLGMRGRISASWAVVAFGSLGVALTTYAVAVVWYGADIIRTQWLGVLLLATVCCAILWGGLHEAFRARWGAMFLYSVAALVVLTILGVQINYAQHFYCMRNHLFLKAPVSAPVSSTPAR